MLAFSVLWVVLAMAVVAAATLRKFASTAEEADRRVAVADRPETRDRGKMLTVMAVVYGLALLAGFFYVGWQHSSQMLK